MDSIQRGGKLAVSLYQSNGKSQTMSWVGDDARGDDWPPLGRRGAENTGYFERLAVDTACEGRLSAGAAAADFQTSQQAIQPVGIPQQCTIGTA